MEQNSLFQKEPKKSSAELGEEAYKNNIPVEQAISQFVAEVKNNPHNPEFLAGHIAEFCNAYQKLATQTICETNEAFGKCIKGLTIPKGKQLILLVEVTDEHETLNLTAAMVRVSSQKQGEFHGLRILDNLRLPVTVDSLHESMFMLNHKTGTISVTGEAFSCLLDALIGHDYQIRELQATRSLDLVNPAGQKKNAINILLDDWNNYAKKMTELGDQL